MNAQKSELQLENKTRLLSVQNLVSILWERREGTWKFAKYDKKIEINLLSI